MNKKILWGIVIVLVFCGLYFGFNKNTEQIGNSSQHIKIGFMLPLSGQFGVVGEGIKNAGMLAVEEYRSAHPNTTVEVVVEDDGFEVKKGIPAYTKLTTLDKVSGIMMISTPVIDAIHEKMNADGLPIVSIGLQNVGVGKDNIFQTTLAPLAPIEYLAKQVAEGKYKKIAIIHNNTLTSLEQFYNTFANSYNGEKVDFVVNDADDARTVATRVMSSGADAVVILEDAIGGPFVTKELKKLDKESKLAYYYDLQLTTGWSEYVKIVGDAKKLNDAHYLQLKSGDMAPFNAKYKAKYATEPTPFSEYGYDSTKVLLEAYNVDQTKWNANIQATSFTGPTGKITFDPNGVRIQEVEMRAVKNGSVSQ